MYRRVYVGLVVLLVLIVGFALPACSKGAKLSDQAVAVRVTKALPPLAAGDSALIEVPPEKSQQIGVSSVKITVLRDAADVTVRIERLSKPSASAAPSNRVYSYLEIAADHLPNYNIGQAIISFEVQKAWLDGNGVREREVSLFRLVEKEWRSLNTRAISASEDRVTFEARTPGFSQFAIGTVSPHTVIVFVGGFTSHHPSLAGEADVFYPLKRLLVQEKNYSDADFLEFGYKGGKATNGAWLLNDYSCTIPSNQALDDSMRLLDDMLEGHALAHPARQIEYVVVGHSFGGLLALRTIPDLTRPDRAFKLQGVITIDSPLSGSSFVNIAAGLADNGVVLSCPGGWSGAAATQLFELHRDRYKTELFNAALMAHTEVASDATVYTLGNMGDPVYYFDENQDSQVVQFGATEISNDHFLGKDPLPRLGWKLFAWELSLADGHTSLLSFGTVKLITTLIESQWVPVSSPTLVPQPTLQVPTTTACSAPWSIGQRVSLRKGAEIREGSGPNYRVHTIVPEDNWSVDVIGGPRCIDGNDWWDISRKNIDNGGTGWVNRSQAQYIKPADPTPAPTPPQPADGIEICDGTNYGRPCQVFTEGRYANLADYGWYDRAESARFLGSYRGNYHVVLHTETNFTGNPYHADNDNPDLGPAHRNHIRSLDIYRTTSRGGIELCDGQNYGAPCQFFAEASPEGKYPDLNSVGFWDRAESVRFVGDCGGGRCHAVLHSEKDFQGDPGHYDNNAPTLGNAQRNHVRSVTVYRHKPPATPTPVPLSTPLPTPTPAALPSGLTFLTRWGTNGTGDGQFFQGPGGIAVDGSGNVYAVDTGNHRVQKFNSNGVFLAKWGTQGSGDGQFRTPLGIAVDGARNVYVADQGNQRVQKFNSDGVFLVKWGSFGGGDGQFSAHTGVAVDNSGNVYVIDRNNHRVQKFSASGVFLARWGTQGSGDGQFIFPEGITVDGSGNIYVADRDNNRVQKFSASGVFLGKWGTEGNGDGQFRIPPGLAVDRSGNVYVADRSNNRVQKFSASGVFLGKWGTQGSGDGQFMFPEGIAVDGSGNVYVADSGNRRVQVFRQGAAPTSMSALPALKVWVSSSRFSPDTEEIRREFQSDFPGWQIEIDKLLPADFLPATGSLSRTGTLPDLAFIDNYSQWRPLWEAGLIRMTDAQDRFGNNGWWVIFNVTHDTIAAETFIRWVTRSPQWEPFQPHTKSINPAELRLSERVALDTYKLLLERRFSTFWSMSDPEIAHFWEREWGPQLRIVELNSPMSFGTSSLSFVMLEVVTSSEKYYNISHPIMVLRMQQADWKPLLLLRNLGHRRGESVLRSFDELGISEGSSRTLPKVNLSYPDDGAQLLRFPPPDLGWATLGTDLVSYVIESQFGQPGIEDSWTTSQITLISPSDSSGGLINVTAPFGVGMQPHRWRVWALDRTGNISISEWRTINFTN